MQVLSIFSFCFLSLGSSHNGCAKEKEIILELYFVVLHIFSSCLPPTSHSCTWATWRRGPHLMNWCTDRTVIQALPFRYRRETLKGVLPEVFKMGAESWIQQVQTPEFCPSLDAGRLPRVHPCASSSLTSRENSPALAFACLNLLRPSSSGWKSHKISQMLPAEIFLRKRNHSLERLFTRSSGEFLKEMEPPKE